MQSPTGGDEAKYRGLDEAVCRFRGGSTSQAGTLRHQGRFQKRARPCQLVIARARRAKETRANVETGQASRKRGYEGIQTAGATPFGWCFGLARRKRRCEACEPAKCESSVWQQLDVPHLQPVWPEGSCCDRAAGGRVGMNRCGQQGTADAGEAEASGWASAGETRCVEQHRGRLAWQRDVRRVCEPWREALGRRACWTRPGAYCRRRRCS
jgi:hypothetical protein